MAVSSSAGEFELLLADVRMLFATAYKHQRVPGLAQDEVHQEMDLCLWHAWNTWEEGRGASFTGHWWRIWVRRKGDLIDQHLAKKRQMVAYVEDVPDQAICDAYGLPPDVGGMELLERRVWFLLSQGFTGHEVRKALHVSWRQYYSIIHHWKNEQRVREALT